MKNTSLCGAGRSAAVLLCFLFLQVHAVAAESRWDMERRPVVAILPVEWLVPEEKADVNAVSQALTAAFIDRGSLRVVERTRLDALLKEQELGQSGAVEAAAAKVGELAGAAKAMLSSITQAGSGYLLILRGVDVATGIQEVSERIAARSVPEFLDLMPVLAERFERKAAGIRTDAVPAGNVPARKAAIGLAVDQNGLGDRSVNDLAYQGLVAAAERAGTVVGGSGAVRFDFQETRAGDYAAALQDLADRGCSLVLAGGFRFREAVGAVASRNPQVRFCLLDSALPDGPSRSNLSAVLFKEEELSFLAGALAALEAGRSPGAGVAFLGGMDIALIRRFEYGFQAGVAAMDPALISSGRYQARIIGTDASAFNDPRKAEALGRDLFAGGCAVVFHASGRSGDGLFKAAAEAGRLAIGVDTDQGFYLSTSRDPAERASARAVLSSGVKRYDSVVASLCAAFLGGRDPEPGASSWGVKEGGVDLALNVFNRSVMSPWLSRIDALRSQIVSGRIRVPDSEESLAAYLKERL